MTEPVCDDCGAEVYGHEYAYMVHDWLWALVRGGRGYLCVGCLEVRLGRCLQSSDFTDVPLNWEPWFRRSDRLQSRLDGRWDADPS